MQDDDSISQVLGIELEYENFLDGLNKTSNAYHSMSKKISKIGSNMSSDMSELHKKIINSTVNMSEKAAKSVQGTLSLINSSIKSSSREISGLQRQVVSDLQEIQRKAIEIAKINKQIDARRRKIEAEKGYSRNENNVVVVPTKADQQILEGAYKNDAVLQQLTTDAISFKQKLSKIYDDFYNSTSIMSKNALMTAANTTRVFADVIDKNIKSVAFKIASIGKFTDNVEIDSKLISAKTKELDKLKKLHEQYAKDIVEIEKKRKNSEDELNVARISADKQTNVYLHEQAQKRYIDAQKEYNKISEIQTKMAERHKVSGESITSVENIIKSRKAQITQEAGNIFTGMSSKMSSSMENIDAIFERMKQEISQMASTGKMNIGSLAEEFSRVKNAINENIDLTTKMQTALKNVGGSSNIAKSEEMASFIKNTKHQRDQLVEAFNTISDSKLVTPILRFKNAIDQATADAKSRVNALYSTMGQLKSLDLSDPNALATSKKAWTSIENQAVDSSKKLNNIQKMITEYSALQNNLRLEIDKEGNTKRAEILNAYSVNVSKIIEKLKSTFEQLSSEFSGGTRFTVAMNEIFKNIEETARSSTKNIIESVKQLKRELKEIDFNTSGKPSVDVSKLISNKSVIEASKASLSESVSNLELLKSQEANAFKALEALKVTAASQTNSKLKKIAEAYVEFQEIKYNKIKEAVANSRRQIVESNEIIASSVGKLKNQFLNIKSDIENTFNIKTDNFLNSAVKIDQLFAELSKNVQSFSNWNTTTFTTGITEISKYNQELQKQLGVIDSLIEEYKRLDKSKIGEGSGIDIKSLMEQREELDKIRKQISDTKTTFENLTVSDVAVKARAELEKTSKAVGDLIKNITLSSNSINKTINKIDPKSIIDTKAVNDKMAKDFEQLSSLKEKLLDRIQSLEIQSYKASLAIAQETNDSKKLLLQSYLSAVKEQVAELQKLYNRADSKKSDTSDVNDALRNNAKLYLRDIKEQIPVLNQIDEIIKETEKHYENLQKATRKKSKESREDAQQELDVLKALQENYRSTRARLESYIGGLTTLTDKKFIDATSTIKELQKIKEKFDKHRNDMRSTAAGMVKDFDAQGRAMAEGLFTRLWKGFRDLRWQYAAAVYMVTQFANFVKNAFVDVLKEISEFRRSVYSVTASIGLSMGQDFKGNFDVMYNYSRSIMEKLEAKAAGTYATLEDLSMVVKSFTQAGNFIRTDQDLEDVATLATAVKVMTEGMANAGTQMKQEISALIQGRQRVTDSVALAFKMQGIDLKAEMEKWEKEGKSRLRGFAELLEPFADINKRISAEYDTQLKNLDGMWKYIKRIAGEQLTLKVADDLSKFLRSIGTIGGDFTEFGQQIVKSVKAGLTIFYEVLKNIGVIAKDLFQQFTNIGSIFSFLTHDFRKGQDHLTAWESTVSTILKTLTAMTAIVRVVILYFSRWIIVAKAVAYAILTIFEGLQGLATGDFSGAKKAFSELEKTITDAYKGISDIVNDTTTGFAEADKTAKKLNESLKSSSTSGADKILDEVERRKKVQEEILELYTEFESVDKKYTPKEEKAENEIEKIKSLRENILKGIKDEQEALKSKTKEVQDGIVNLSKASQVQLQIQNGMTQIVFEETCNKVLNTAETMGIAIEGVSGGVSDAIKNQVEETKSVWDDFYNWMKSKGLTGKWFDPKWRDNKEFSISKMLETGNGIIENEENKQKEQVKSLAEIPEGGVKSPLEKIKEREQELVKLREKIISDSQEKINKILNNKDGKKSSKTYEDFYAEYTALLERLNNLNPFERISSEYKANLAEIAKLAQDNAIIRANYEELVTLAKRKGERDWAEAVEVANDRYMDLRRKASKLDQTEFEKLDEEYSNLSRSVEKLYQAGELGQGKLNESRKKELDLTIELGKQYAINKLKLEAMKDVWDQQLSNINTVTNMMAESYNPSIQRQGEMISLQTEFVNNQIDAADKIRAYGDKWGYSSEQFKNYSKVVVDGLALQEMQMNDQLERVQKPFWDDVNQMSQGWIDSISDGIYEVSTDFTKFGEVVHRILDDITKQIITAGIKRFIVEPAFNSMDSNKNSNSLIQDQLANLSKLQQSSNQNLQDALLGRTLGSTPARAMWVQTVGSAAGLTSNMENAFSLPSKDYFKDTFSLKANEFQSKDWYDTAIQQSLSKNIEPSLTLAMIKAESAGKIGALSGKGASGLMQLMPGTASGLGYSSSDMSNPNLNIAAGTTYMQQMLNKTGSISGALQAYNAGPGNYDKYGGNVPFKETRDYVDRVLKYKKEFETLESPYKVVSDTWKSELDNEGFGSLGGNKLPNPISLTSDLWGNQIESQGSQLMSNMGGLGAAQELMNITANVVNVNGAMGGVGVGSAAPVEQVATQTQGMFSRIYDGFKNIFSSLFTSVKGIFSGLGSILSGIGGGGSKFGLLGNIFSLFKFHEGGLVGKDITSSDLKRHIGLKNKEVLAVLLEGERVLDKKQTRSFEGLIGDLPRFHEGGLVGTGLRSGAVDMNKIDKSFNDQAKLKKSNVSNKDYDDGVINNHFSVNINAIDSKSGVEFLAGNTKILENIISRSIKKNRGIRREISSAY